MLPVKLNLLPTVSRFFEDDWNNIFDWNNRDFTPHNFTLPSVNIEDNKDHILINLAAPGMKKEDFRVELKDNMLMIAGESKHQESEQEGNNFSLREFNYSRFNRRFNLNESFVDEQKIEARYENGILTIRLAKKEAAKEKPSKQIVVK